MSANFVRRGARKKTKVRGRRRRAPTLPPTSPPAPIQNLAPPPSAQIVSWQMQHQIAYWKSKAVALSYENKVLHAIIADLYSGKSQLNKQTLNPDPEDSENEPENEFEISEEMLQFLQKSAEHRRLREKEKKNKQNINECGIDLEAPPDVGAADKKRSKMEALYGKSADDVINLETAVQLNYDRYLDSNNPVYWPNIPLKL